MNTVQIVAVCILAFLVFFYISSIIYFKTGFLKVFFHNVLGWHQPKSESKFTFDGCSTHCTCKYCGKDIMQDSQGNWF